MPAVTLVFCGRAPHRVALTLHEVAERVEAAREDGKALVELPLLDHVDPTLPSEHGYLGVEHVTLVRRLDPRLLSPPVG